MSSNLMYATKNESYFNTSRMDVLDLLRDKQGVKILEIGAGTGATLVTSKDLGIASEVTGIELMRIEGSGQDNPTIDRFIIGDLNSALKDIERSYFDVVICADVLEHLVDPWSVLKELHERMVEGGTLVVSLPNFRNHRVLRKLIVGGSFEYADSGILDKTHLRFFCKKDIIEMLESCSFKVEFIKEHMGAYGVRHKLADGITLKLLHDFFVFQYVVVVRKN
jgi:2-polyprenyl-3-methyl-5-hydroxy-6-metoxy-1,4-benzoquinol methylase